MSTFATIMGVVIAYFALQLLILPKLGVQT